MKNDRDGEEEGESLEESAGGKRAEDGAEDWKGEEIEGGRRAKAWLWKVRNREGAGGLSEGTGRGEIGDARHPHDHGGGDLIG